VPLNERGGHDDQGEHGDRDAGDLQQVLNVSVRPDVVSSRGEFQTPIGCQTVLVSQNAPRRAMPGSAYQSSISWRPVRGA
jgi:hypothetical protein